MSKEPDSIFYITELFKVDARMDWNLCFFQLLEN